MDRDSKEKQEDAWEERRFEQQVGSTHRLREQLFSAIQEANVALAREWSRTCLVLLRKNDMGILKRSEDSLRSAKNIILGFNTLLSYAAESGGMNAVTGHYKAERYAVMIERARSEAEVWNIFCEYCEDYADRRGEGPQAETISEQVMEYIGKNFTNALSIREIAGALHLNESYLMRRFKQETGGTIQHAITQKRINEACRLLAGSNLTITEAGALAGFHSSAYFSLLFREQIGLTPSQYREHMRKAHPIR